MLQAGGGQGAGHAGGGHGLGQYDVSQGLQHGLHGSSQHELPQQLVNTNAAAKTAAIDDSRVFMKTLLICLVVWIVKKILIFKFFLFFAIPSKSPYLR